MISVIHLSFARYKPLTEEDDSSEVLAWHSAYWETLRSFFEEHRFPPSELLDPIGSSSEMWEQRHKEAFQQLDDWQWSYLQQPAHQDDFHAIFTPPADYASPWYIKVGHLHGKKQHYDLFLISPEGEHELLFFPRDQAEHREQALRDTLFVPLLQRIRDANLDMTRIGMAVSFADEQGLHTVGLPFFFKRLGLLSP